MLWFNSGCLVATLLVLVFNITYPKRSRLVWYTLASISLLGLGYAAIVTLNDCSWVLWMSFTAACLVFYVQQRLLNTTQLKPYDTLLFGIGGLMVVANSIAWYIGWDIDSLSWNWTLYAYQIILIVGAGMIRSTNPFAQYTGWMRGLKIGLSWAPAVTYGLLWAPLPSEIQWLICHIFLVVFTSAQTIFLIWYQRLRVRYLIKAYGQLVIKSTLCLLGYSVIFWVAVAVISVPVLVLGGLMGLSTIIFWAIWMWISQEVRMIDSRLIARLDHAIRSSKTMMHVYNAIEQYCHSFEGMIWQAHLGESPTSDIYMHRRISDDESHYFHSISDNSVNIFYELAGIYVHITTRFQDGRNYWFLLKFPQYCDWISMSHKANFSLIVTGLSHTLQLIESNEHVNRKMSNIANINESMSRPQLMSIDVFFYNFLKSFQRLVGMDAFIMMDFLGVEVSTVYVPSHIRKVLNGVSVQSLFDTSWDPVLCHRDDPDMPQGLAPILRKYGVSWCCLIPITYNNQLQSYYIGLLYSEDVNIDLQLVHLMNNQLATFMGRLVTNHQIRSDHEFHQGIMDSLAFILIIFDESFKILFLNNVSMDFFNASYNTLEDMVAVYPQLACIRDMYTNPDTYREVIIQLEESYYKVVVSALSEKRVASVLIDVTDTLEMRRGLRQSSTLKGMGTFVAGVAHEIKNPLVAVKTFIQLISRDWGNQNLREKFRTIVEPQLMRINQLADSLNFLDYTNGYNFELVNISAVIHQALLLLKTHSDNNPAVQMRLDITPNVYIWGSYARLAQLITNLYVNAQDAVYGNDNPWIRVSLVKQDANTMILDVADNGVGIPINQQSAIFDPFFTTKDSGTGLGLSIVYQIVLEHKGQIFLADSSNDGSVFRVVFPTCEGPSEGNRR